jgi:hypothetical protein
MREIIREPEFEQELHALLPDPAEADDFTAGAELLLAVYSDAGLPVTTTGSIWYLPMAPIDGRAVSLYYTFDESNVYLLSIVAHYE